MDDPVIETVPLGAQWPTVDPFLFCAHHDDAYPAGNGRNGPAASLDGRAIGQDFAGIDGWNMYHGSTVPGFPQHPHRGFETITFVRRGLVDHADSLGAAARYGRGDVQWMTAGWGIVHSEMFPLVDETGPNHLQLFQIWLNLPARDKLVEPHFTMMWDDRIPRLEAADRAGARTTVTVIAGPLAGLAPPDPPPSSWAAAPEADVALWHVRMDPGAEWELPPAEGAQTLRTLYLFAGEELHIGESTIGGSTAARVRCDGPIVLRAGPGETELMVLQGRPIGEPVAQHGPFVMNDRDGIRQAFVDYQQSGFGGWPWDRPDPVHTDAQGRFARHADGRVERVPVG